MTRITLRLYFSVCILAIAGCGGPTASDGSVTGDADTLARNATGSSQVALRFDGSDEGVVREGALKPGTRLLVEYAAQRSKDRLTAAGCSLPMYQVPHVRVFIRPEQNDNAIQSGDLSEGSTGNPFPFNFNFSVPAASNLQLWFKIDNRSGCEVWDSKNAQNYRFEIQKDSSQQSQVGIRFDQAKAGFVRDGQVLAGTHLLVEYSVQRSTDRLVAAGCSLPQYQVPHVRLFIRPDHDDNAIQSGDLSQGTGGNPFVSNFDFKVPAAGELQIWFKIDNRAGCEVYDSRNAANYAFSVVR